jgi:NTP pyrophosphatase (non-canonical NTP hydrolase)
MNERVFDGIREADILNSLAYSDMHSERIRAHNKHDTLGGSMERKTWDDPAWLPVVVEEVGEVAHAMTYDAPDADLRTELVQVGAMVAAWIDAIDAEFDP